MKNTLVLLAVVLGFLSCKETKKESAAPSAAAETSLKPEVKLFAFSGGTVMVNNLELFSQDTTYHGQS